MSSSAKPRPCSDCGFTLPAERFDGNRNTCRKCRKNRERSAFLKRIRRGDDDVCKRCETEKPLSEFHHGGVCKSCYNAEHRDLYYALKEANAESNKPRKCDECEELKPATAFEGIRSRCKSCRHGLQRKIVKDFIESMKTNCAICGYDDLAAIEFAHFDREEKARSKNGLPICLTKLGSIARVKEELAKGRWLCCFCHRLETADENGADKRYNGWRKRNLEAVLLEKEARGECLQCEMPFDRSLRWAFDFDHRDPSQKQFNICDAVKQNLDVDVIRAEMDKCDLLCANCHRLKTIIEAKEKKGKKRTREDAELTDDDSDSSVCRDRPQSL